MKARQIVQQLDHFNDVALEILELIDIWRTAKHDELIVAVKTAHEKLDEARHEICDLADGIDYHITETMEKF
jgi:hypothetical protein